MVFFWPAILIMGYNGDLFAESKESDVSEYLHM